MLYSILSVSFRGACATQKEVLDVRFPDLNGAPAEVETVAYAEDRGVRTLRKTGTEGDLFFAHDLKHHQHTQLSENEFEDLRLYSRYEHRERAESRRRLGDSSSATDPLQITPVFQGIGTHYADVWVGEPEPQR